MKPAERFLVWRRRNGLSQVEAARRMAVARSAVLRIESGAADPLRWMLDRELPLLPSPAEELWLLRWRHRLTTKEAAAAIDVSTRKLYNMENGLVDLKLFDIKSIELAYVYQGAG